MHSISSLQFARSSGRPERKRWDVPGLGQPRPAPRRGFTLVELLVVIGIIGMITAIAVPTIFGAIASARNAKTKAEIDMLHMALMNYKNEYGSFPPANMAGLWNGTSVNPNHPAYKHLVRIFPRLSEDTTAAGPYRAMSQLSPAQALVFWLQGFYENPEQPLTNRGTPATRKKFFDFDQSRLYAVKNDLSAPYNAYTVGSLPADPTAAAKQSFQTLPSGNEFQQLYPVYFTGHPSCGLPYVYFDSRCYSSSAAGDVVYVAKSMNGDDSIAAPYIASSPPPNPTWGQNHMAADTFQIIAAGKDGVYGRLTPTALQTSFPANAGSPPPPGGYWSAGNTTAAPGHADNLTNFADRALADAIEALK
jgi:prepilin-type N-terminal cleavage/methylation domain-containing protein